MNYYKWIILVITVLTTNAYAFQSKIEIFEQFDNIRVVAFINEDDITNSPMWSPDTDPLPLTITGAIQAVRDFTKQSKITGSVKEIEIRTVNNHPGYWHYLIKIAANSANKNKYNIYVVLMDGKVIPAFIEPETYK